MSAPLISAADGMARLVTEIETPPFHATLKPFAKAFDAEIGEVRIGLAYRPEFSFSRIGDFYHGGVLATLIDIAGHAAVAVQIGRTAPTIDLRIDYLRPAPGVELTACARVLRLGRAIARADISVYEADDKLVAVGRGTFSTM